MAIKIDLENIQTLTDFKRNAKEYVERVKSTKSPLVLTVNGKAEVVVHEARAFQELLNRLERMEEELRAMKLEALRTEVEIGIEQSERGEVAPLDIEAIKRKGRRRLAQKAR